MLSVVAFLSRGPYPPRDSAPAAEGSITTTASGVAGNESQQDAHHPVDTPSNHPSSMRGPPSKLSPAIRGSTATSASDLAGS